MTRERKKDRAYIAIVLIALGLGFSQKKVDTAGYAPREERATHFWEKQPERERDEVSPSPAGSVRTPLARGQGEYISRETREKERQKALKREELAIKIETGIAVGLLCSILLSVAMAKWYAKQEKAEWEELSRGSIPKEFNTKEDALKAYYRGEEGKERVAKVKEIINAIEPNFLEAVCQEILEYTDEVVYEREEGGLEAVLAGCKRYINATDLEKLVDVHCSLPISFPFEGEFAERYKREDAERTRILAGYWRQNHTDEKFFEKATFYRIVFYENSIKFEGVLPAPGQALTQVQVQAPVQALTQTQAQAQAQALTQAQALARVLARARVQAPVDAADPIFVFSLRGREEIESFISGARPVWSPKSITLGIAKEAFVVVKVLLSIALLCFLDGFSVMELRNLIARREWMEVFCFLAHKILYVAMALSGGEIWLYVRYLWLTLRSVLYMNVSTEDFLFYLSDLRSMFCVALLGTSLGSVVGLKELILFIILSNLLTWGMKKLAVSKWLLKLDREEENSAFCLLFLPLSLGGIAMLITTLAFNSFPYPALIGFATALLALALGQFWGSYLTLVRNTISLTSEVKSPLFFFSPNDKGAFLLFIWRCNYALLNFLFGGLVSVDMLSSTKRLFSQLLKKCLQ